MGDKVSLNLTMLCDFYELTMGNGYFEKGYKDRICYFDVFYRLCSKPCKMDEKLVDDMIGLLKNNFEKLFISVKKVRKSQKKVEK